MNDPSGRLPWSICSDPRLRRALTRAHKAGWEIKATTHGFMAYPPTGERPIAVHTSNRGGRRQKPNALVQLRRAGLRI